jgi:hypothetical protein
MTPFCRLVFRFLSRDDAAWLPLFQLLRRLPRRDEAASSVVMSLSLKR